MPSNVPETVGRTVRENRLLLLSVSTTAFLTTFTASSIIVALPSIAREFGTPHAQLQYISSAYLIVNAAMLVPFGKLADIIGRKVFFLAGLLLFLAAHSLAPLAAGPWWLIACRALGGFAAAMFFSNDIALISSTFPASGRGRALGTNVSFAYLGLTTGPVIGGMITTHWGWRGIFIGIVPIIVLGLYLAWNYIPDDFRRGRLKRSDVKAAVVYIAGILAAAGGIPRLPEPGGIALCGCGAALLALFAAADAKARQPFMNIRRFLSNGPFVAANLANFMQYITTTATAFMLSLFLQNKGLLNLSAKAAGIILLAQPATQFILSPIAGTLSDRYNPRRIATLGMGICAATLLVFSFQDGQSPAVLLAGLMLVLGAGMGLFTSPNNNLTMGSIPPEAYGIGSGILSTGRILGMAMSFAVTAVVFKLFQSTEGDAATFLLSFKAVFLVFCAGSLACFLFLLARGPSPARRSAHPCL